MDLDTSKVIISETNFRDLTRECVIMKEEINALTISFNTLIDMLIESKILVKK